MSLIGLLVLAAAPVAAEPPASRTPLAHAQCQAAAIRPIGHTHVNPRSRAWSVRRVLDLQFETRLRPGTGAPGVELRVYTPGGHLYRTLEATASSERPASTKRAKRRPTEPLKAVMPVAGTGIVRNGLYGRWRVVPHLTGDAQPCGRPVSFGLAP